MYQYDIAFIIPAYNIGEFLEECLKSIIMQTNVNKQIIIVNDGSTDNTIDVAMSYESKYDYVKLINKNNEGVSIARNIGLDYSDAEYICFLDGDDIYLKDFAHEFLSLCRKYHLDIIRGQYKLFGKTLSTNNYPETIICNGKPMSGTDFLRKSMRLKTSEVVPWLGFFSSSFLQSNHIRFPEGIAFTEDQLFFLECLLKSKNVMDIKSTFYGYRIRQNSATSGSYSEKKVKDIFYIFDKEMELSIAQPQIKNSIIAYSTTTLSQVFAFYKRANSKQKEDIISYLSSYKKMPIILHAYNLKIGIKLLVATRCPALLKLYR